MVVPSVLVGVRDVTGQKVVGELGFVVEMSLQKSVKSVGGDRSDQADTTSICSSVTTQPDRHGFFGGAQYSPEP